VYFQYSLLQAHELLALEVLTLLLEKATDDSVELAVGFLKECGQKLTEVSPKGINAIFERLRSILHESEVHIRVQYMIEVSYCCVSNRCIDHKIIYHENNRSVTTLYINLHRKADIAVYKQTK